MGGECSHHCAIPAYNTFTCFMQQKSGWSPTVWPFRKSCDYLDTVSFSISFFFFFQEESKQERANVDIVWQLENKNKEIQTLNARVQKVLLFSLCH